MKRVVFNLKRYWLMDDGSTVDLYEEIKAGRKTSEWRNRTSFWAKRLCPCLCSWNIPQMQGRDLTCQLKVNRAWFVVGYPKGNLPRLEADITKLFYHKDTDQFEIQFINVKEVLENPKTILDYTIKDIIDPEKHQVKAFSLILTQIKSAVNLA